MANLTVQKLAVSGLVPALVPAEALGDEFSNNGTTFLQVVNGSGAPITVTLNRQKCNFGFDHPVDVAVAAGAEKLIGPFPTPVWNLEGKVEIKYSSVTSVTVGVFSL